LAKLLRGSDLAGRGDSLRCMGRGSEFDHPKAPLGSAGTKQRRRHSATARSGRWVLVRNGFVVYTLLHVSLASPVSVKACGLQGAGALDMVMQEDAGREPLSCFSENAILAAMSWHRLWAWPRAAASSPPTHVSKLPPGNHQNTNPNLPRYYHLRSCGAGHADQRLR
jgi:hypothetical protein